MFVCPIRTQESLDRSAPNFGWGTRKNIVLNHGFKDYNFFWESTEKKKILLYFSLKWLCAIMFINWSCDMQKPVQNVQNVQCTCQPKTINWRFLL